MNESQRPPVILLVALCAAIAGCAGLNDALTPSVQILHDKFDGTTIVRQDPVSASEDLADEFHTLGFEWSTRTPKQIFVTAGTYGTTRVNNVAFNADGQILAALTLASDNTEFESGWSSRRFAMPIEDFLKIARAQSVQMKLSQGNNYTVSSFGTDHPNAAVNAKFKPFTDKVLEISSSF